MALLLFSAITAIIILRDHSNDDVFVQTAGKRGNPLLIIDAGHGGEDGGASSSDGFLESSVNLLISQKIELILTI